MPLVSIITPVFNAEKYLPKTINSVLEQTFQDWELFLIDDLSKDQSRKIIQEFSERDSRIKPIFKERNTGSADTRNLGIQLAQGKYIAFLDADDLWDASFLEKSIQTLQDFQVAFCFSSYRIIDEEGHEFLPPFLIEERNYTYEDILLYNRVGLLTAIYDQSIMDIFRALGLTFLHLIFSIWKYFLKKFFY